MLLMARRLKAFISTLSITSVDLIQELGNLRGG